MSKATPLAITAMTEADLATVMALERENPGPWHEPQLAGELGQPFGWQWLARNPRTGTIVGYIIGRTVADEAEILRLAVAHSHRRRGIAQALLDHTFTRLRANAASCCFLELRASNSGARHLYEKNGFTVAGHRTGYYLSPAEDAMVMTKPLVDGVPS